MPLPPPPNDTITLRALHLTATIGPDAWSRPSKPQPLTLTLALTLPSTAAAASASSTDNLAHTFSYGTMCKHILAHVDAKEFLSLDDLTTQLAQVADAWPGEMLKVGVVAPKALLRAEGGLGREVLLRRGVVGRQMGRGEGEGGGGWCVESHEWVINSLKIACVIGVNEHERLEKQVVSIDLRLLGADSDDDDNATTEQAQSGAVWRDLVRRVCEVVEASSFKTLEALAALVAKTVLEGFAGPRVMVRVEKPSALAFVEGAGVEIVRDRQFLLGEK